MNLDLNKNEEKGNLNKILINLFGFQNSELPKIIGF